MDFVTDNVLTLSVGAGAVLSLVAILAVVLTSIKKKERKLERKAMEMKMNSG